MCNTYRLPALYHEDPSALHVGTTPNRGYYHPHGPEGQSRVHSLSGEWAFRYFDSFLDAVDEDGNVVDNMPTGQQPEEGGENGEGTPDSQEEVEQTE